MTEKQENIQDSELETKVINFEIEINAEVEKVWKTMLEKPTYELWTSVFEANSTYDGSWEQGADINFISKDESAHSGGGMAGFIKENRYLKFVSIVYKGVLVGGLVDVELSAKYSPPGAYENYTFTSLAENKTKLEIEMLTTTSFADNLQEMWPKALLELKKLCEK